MRNTAVRVQLARKLARDMRKRRRDRSINLLFVLCCALLWLDVSILTQISDVLPFHTSEKWMYGASMLPSDAGGYVLVAVVTFVLAVVFTLLCMKHHEQTRQQEKERHEEPRE